MQTKIRVLVIILAGLIANWSSADPLTISQIRQGHSSMQNQWVDVVGGVVTFKSNLGTRVVLQDPTTGEYAGIQIRDLNSMQNDTGGWLWSRVNVGDFVSFSNVRVTEWTGNTMLRYNDPARPNNSFPLSSYTIVSSGNPLPPPVSVTLAEILAPMLVPVPPSSTSYNIDPSALADYQKLESMRLMVEDVRVTALDVGRFGDNYTLHSQSDVGASGPSAFAADYNNYNKDSSNDYHPLVDVGAEFDSIVAYLERSKASSTPDDYYQLVTMTTSSFTVPSTLIPGDFDGDSDVDGADFVAWQANFPKATGGTLATGDADGDGDVDGADFVVWQTNFPTPSSTGASPIPEPTGLMLTLLANATAFCFRQLRAVKRDPR